ncbi:CLUMA_CG018625, isoform A [Clunio marinus]|uniref:CLUMA_CG018625, isoform A n=1 Tax=Clunio marinus TaxID=568069 RepID=A0A1J1IZL2_9DIPT|nr:CLUMA_CG018625, isoform A [Clunio marinus]
MSPAQKLLSKYQIGAGRDLLYGNNLPRSIEFKLDNSGNNNTKKEKSRKRKQESKLKKSLDKHLGNIV